MSEGFPPPAVPGPWVRLDLESPVPVWLQLYRQVATAILDGTLAVGSPVPSARSLAGQLGIHYHTVNKSYLRLRHDGFLVLSHRKVLEARRPPAPGHSYLADWNDRQSALLSEALVHGVSPEEILSRFSGLLERARRPRAGGGRAP